MKNISLLLVAMAIVMPAHVSGLDLATTKSGVDKRQATLDYWKSRGSHPISDGTPVIDAEGNRYRRKAIATSISVLLPVANKPAPRSEIATFPPDFFVVEASQKTLHFKDIVPDGPKNACFNFLHLESDFSFPIKHCSKDPKGARLNLFHLSLVRWRLTFLLARPTLAEWEQPGLAGSCRKPLPAP